MTIKTGRIRRKFDEALQDRIVCDNMLLMSISALNYEIQYNSQISDKTVTGYIKFRSQLAKCAITHGVTKNKITKTMQLLSSERYPSYNQILKLINLLNENSYEYIADYIPDSDMKYKTDTELQDTNSQPVIQRNQNSIESEQQFNEICEIIKINYGIDITTDMQAKLRQIKESNDIILQALQWHLDDIHKITSGKHFKNSYEKFCYIVGVIKKNIPDTVMRLENDKKRKIDFWNGNASVIVCGDMTLDEMVSLQCDDDKYANYGKHDYVRKELLEAIERVKQMKAEEEKQEQEIESPQEIESVVIADNDSAKINKNDNDPKNKPIIERIRLLVNGEYLLIDQKYEIAKKEIREMISYLKCEIENKSNDMQKQKKLQQDLDFCDEYECKINNKHDIELCPFLADDYEEEEW